MDLARGQRVLFELFDHTQNVQDDEVYMIIYTIVKEWSSYNDYIFILIYVGCDVARRAH